jgi:hypothetical protein
MTVDIGDPIFVIPIEDPLNGLAKVELWSPVKNLLCHTGIKNHRRDVVGAGW